jgi:hypothetical protein
MSTQHSKRHASWLQLSPESMKQLTPDHRNYILAELEQDGRDQLTKERIAEFNAVRDRRLPREKEHIATFIAVFVGALTFSVAPQLLASQAGRGPFALSTGFAGGAAASFFAHANATKTLTGLKLKKNTSLARRAIAQKQN